MAPPKKTKAPAPGAAVPAAPTGQASTPAAPQRSEVKGSGTGSGAAPAAKEITWHAIEQRAYEIYANRGYAPGDPSADWFEAERQLKAGL